MNSYVTGIGLDVSAASLPRSTSTPVIMGQRNAVQGVGIAPLVILGLGALAGIGGFGYWAGRASGEQPQTLTGEIGKQIGSGLKWAALGYVGYTLITGNNPIKKLFKK